MKGTNIHPEYRQKPKDVCKAADQLTCQRCRIESAITSLLSRYIEWASKIDVIRAMLFLPGSVCNCGNQIYVNNETTKQIMDIETDTIDATSYAVKPPASLRLTYVRITRLYVSLPNESLTYQTDCVCIRTDQ